MPENVQHLPVGTIIGNGKYRIVRFIAAGGFGCTYEAEFMMMRTRVAIKEFFINSMCNREATGAISLGAISQSNLIQKLEDKFLREAQNLFALSHPNIVGVKDVFRELGTSYYVMDYIDGQSLQSLIEERGPLPEAQLMKYMTQVMDALEYVHDKKMLHLDLKPDNIMIDRNDRAILIDFGVAKQYDEVDGHNTSTILGQTPGYAPIEQMSNNMTNFAPSTDIYALGATMYAALTAQAPPSAPNLLAGTESLAPLPQDVSMQIRCAIDLMMSTRSADRPQSIAAVRALLRQPFNPQFNPISQPANQQQQFNHNPQQPYFPHQGQPYSPQPMQPYPPVGVTPKPKSGLKVAKFVFMSLAILFTSISIIYSFALIGATYGYEEDLYAGLWLLFNILAIPCWILFGVFGKKYSKSVRERR